MFKPLVDHVESSIERTDGVEFVEDDELVLEETVDEDDNEVEDNDVVDDETADEDWVELLLEIWEEEEVDDVVMRVVLVVEFFKVAA